MQHMYDASAFCMISRFYKNMYVSFHECVTTSLEVTPGSLQCIFVFFDLLALFDIKWFTDHELIGYWQLIELLMAIN